MVLYSDAALVKERRVKDWHDKMLSKKRAGADISAALMQKGVLGRPQ